MHHLRIILIFGNIILLRHLCIATMCPVPVSNAVLSSTCSRRIGDSCSFSCTRGHVPTTSDKIVCTSDGTWNLDTTTLCPDKLGPFLSKENSALYLKGRSNRVKRGINEECRETRGCSYEEIREIGVTDVCAWMENRLCSQLNCPVEYLCVTTIKNCDNLNYYRVECQAILCPVPVGNAVLSSTCSRKIGDSCSFSCTQGYVPTTSDNIVCNSDETWTLDTATLCEPILCPVPVGNAVLSSTCNRQIRDSCSFSCTQGYVPTTSDNIVCNSDGTWNLDTATICEPILCPVPVGNAVLSSTCSRQIGDSCSFSCTQGYIPSTSDNIVCNSDGTWNLDTATLCELIHCPLDVINGNTLSSCRGLVGEKCDVTCDNSSETVYIVCLSSGSWDKDTTAICSLKHESESSTQGASKMNITFLYAGAPVAGTLIIILIIVGVTCLKKRRDDKARNFNQGMPSNTENRVHFVSVNNGYEKSNDHAYSKKIIPMDNAVYEIPNKATSLS